jgi:superfamily I DNA/RNA helicase/RecB family exonuclease
MGQVQGASVRGICLHGDVNPVTRPSYRLRPSPRQVLERVELTPEQEAVVNHRGGPLLVLAGPGTGKTTTIVEAVAAHIDDGLPADTVLVLTFSRRAALDLRRRIAERLGRSVVTPRAMTFHAFCYAVVRRWSDPELYGMTPRLLTAPEQEFRVREVLGGRSETDWPPEYAPAYGTRGFAGEVRGALAAARQLGLDGDVLRLYGSVAERPQWSALGDFFDEYLDVLEQEQVLDYAELVHRTRVLLTDPEVLAQVRRSAEVVFVDEYQDTDPSQVALLRQLVPLGGDIVVVGDPDQSIYEFRGARPRGILDFPEEFSDVGGIPAGVIALSRTHRFGEDLADATRRISARLPLPRPLPDGLREAFREPEICPGTPPGQLDVLTFDDPGAEASHIADLLRRAHLYEGVDWDDMAVLVRSGRRDIPRLTRSLMASGVPVSVAGDEVALASAEAVSPLLLALAVVADPGLLDADSASRLLQSPLAGLDSIDLRRLGRGLRELDRADVGLSVTPASSDELVRQALEDPDLLAGLPPTEATAATAHLAALLAECRELVARGATAHEALWCLWSGTDWPQRLQAQLAMGGDPAARAHRDLDALCALFDLAERSDELTGGRGVAGFLAEVASQEIPADTAREATVRRPGVRVLTAHRAKGLEWPLVVVAGVQEGVWPDPRRRDSMLETDLLGVDGIVDPPPPSVRLAAERRLFYVACTRATRHLVVTAVAGTDGEGDQPSRFLDELGVPVRAVAGRPPRPLTLVGLVGELRRAAVDPQEPPAVRAAAARHLSTLADEVDVSGRQVVPLADPARWWGLAERSTGRAIRGGGEPVSLSGSQLGTLLGCPRQWFLQRRAGADRQRTSAAGFGSVVHVLAEHAVAEGISPTELGAHLERVWDQIPFDAVWLSTSERAEADEALERLAGWIESRAGRTVLGVEVPFSVEVQTTAQPLRLTGVVDRLDLTSDGRLVIVDFKTGRHVPTQGEADSLEQLGAYQLAAQLGAFSQLAGEAPVGGAELVYLRKQDGQQPYPKVLKQASIVDVPYLKQEPSVAVLDAEDRLGVGQQADHPTWVHHRLETAARVLASERYVATLGESCRYCAFQFSCPARGEGRQVVE